MGFIAIFKIFALRSPASELCCRHCSVFVSFSLYWGNWQQEMFRLNNIHRATMTEISFNKHIKTSSSAFAHSKCVSKLSVVPRIWFLFSGTCDEPLLWNSSKRQIERHLWHHFFKSKCDKQSLRFKLLFNIWINLHFDSWCIRRYHESNFFFDHSKLPAWFS